MEFFEQSKEQVLQNLGTDPQRGLTKEQVTCNAAKYGKNVFAKAKPKSLWRSIFEAATEPMLLLLFFAWAITIAVNTANALRGGEFDLAECIGIFLAIAVSVVLTVTMEGRSARAFAALNTLEEGSKVKVLRGGAVQYLPRNELTVGDIVFLQTGDKIAADGRLLETAELTCDESALTGESMPAAKDEKAQLLPTAPLAERANCVYAGCFVTGGSGKMVVTEIGDQTQFGKIAQEIRGGNRGKTPLQEKLGKLGKGITAIGAAVAALVFLIQLVYAAVNGSLSFQSVSHLFISAIILVVAAVPEGLPTIMAIALSINVARMAKRNALVKKLVACETIGSVNVICSDKTGTLTENKMTAVDFWTEGKFVSETDCSEAMLENFCLNATADLFEENGKVRFVGNPTEGALLVAARNCGAEYRAMRAEREIAAVYPFSSDVKNMTSCIRTQSGYRVYTKGSPEKILSLCIADEKEKKVIKEGVEALQSEARRVLAFAHKDTAVLPQDRAEAERGMVLDGFVGIADPLRKETYAAVQDCRNAGIEVKMLTGDNIVTAKAIAKELSIAEEGGAFEAGELEALSEEEFAKILPQVRVIARSTPLLKMRVVQQLKAQGNVVAVTGDGINDAPALKNADVGIAMGISGTEVSKEAADIVLLDDSFATIATTIKWGRGIYENFRRFIRFQLTVNVASVLIVFFTAVVGLFAEGFVSPFSALDLLWINVIMDGPPALTLGLEPVREDVMKKRPTPRGESIVSGGMFRRILFTGAYVCLVCLAQSKWNFLCVAPDAVATSVFTLFVLFQLFNAFNCRETGSGSIFPRFFENKAMLAAFAAAFGLQILITQFGGGVFDTVALGFLDWLKLIGLSLSVIAVEEIVKCFLRLAEKKKSARA